MNTSKIELIDSHCHLDFSEFDSKRRELIASCQKLGIIGVIVPGVSAQQPEHLLNFKVQYPQFLHIAFGLHPYFLTQTAETDMQDLILLANQHKKQLCAIGECGIDRSHPNLELQQRIFIAHILLANDLKLPLIVHHRQSHDLIQAAFKQCPPKHGGVIHAFSGSIQIARYYIQHGFKLGVGGIISYERSQKTRETIATIALQSLLIETDAPSMPLFGAQGQPNSPLALIDVFTHLVALRKEPAEEIAEQLRQSCSEIFRI